MDCGSPPSGCPWSVVRGSVSNEWVWCPWFLSVDSLTTVPSPGCSARTTRHSRHVYSAACSHNTRAVSPLTPNYAAWSVSAASGPSLCRRYSVPRTGHLLHLSPIRCAQCARDSSAGDCGGDRTAQVTTYLCGARRASKFNSLLWVAQGQVPCASKCI